MIVGVIGSDFSSHKALQGLARQEATVLTTAAALTVALLCAVGQANKVKISFKLPYRFVPD
jgi:hypothetical protein